MAPLAEGTPFEWLAHLRRSGVSIQVSENDSDELLATMLCSPGLPALEVPEELRYTEASIAPRPGLRIRAPESSTNYSPKLRAELSFDYEGRIVSANDTSRGLYDAAARHFLRRDAEAEKSATGLLNELGLKFRASSYDNPSPRWELAPTKLPRTVRALLEAGWHIDADGKIFRRPGSFHIQS